MMLQRFVQQNVVKTTLKSYTPRCQLAKIQLRGCASKHQADSHPLVGYLRSLKWVPIPIGVGFAYIGYHRYDAVVKREERLIQKLPPEELVASKWQVRLYRALPLKLLSRLWGKINSLEVPVALREPLFGLYIRAFNCNMDEAQIRDLTHYRNLGEFFARRLRTSSRPVDQNHPLTCPSDGRVLHFGRVERGMVEQVKGITYPLSDFLGPAHWSPDSPRLNHSKSPAVYEKKLKKIAENDLYHCVVYLAPGDYHGFHSPVHWTVNYRRHFPGDLLSVSPGIVRWIRGLFNLNERVVYVGHWREGFFAMAAVGATNVGSVKVYHDKMLSTNSSEPYKDGTFWDQDFRSEDLNGIPMQKGASFGEFNLGSTIVLIFEAPKNFQFHIKPGQSVKFGQALGSCQER